MEKAVIDSSSLIFALKINGLISLLEKRFDCLLVPDAVYLELTAKDAPEVNDAATLFSNGFLKRVDVKNTFNNFLGRGESEAVSLAFKKKLSCVCDDRKAVLLGQSIGVRVIPISSFIIWGVKKKFLSKKEGEELLNDLVEAGYYLKTHVYVEILKEIRQ